MIFPFTFLLRVDFKNKNIEFVVIIILPIKFYIGQYDTMNYRKYGTIEKANNDEKLNYFDTKTWLTR